MCRSIRPLRGRSAPPPTVGDVHDAAVQYVRKIAAVRAPAARDAAAFEAAVGEVAAATARLLAAMGAPAVPGAPTPPSEWLPRPRRRPPVPAQAGRSTQTGHSAPAADPPPPVAEGPA
jgi:hypothetical protein